jgi:LigXa C-terminal domain like
VQKSDTYSGIEGVNRQDRAVQESMGPDRRPQRGVSRPADRAIIAMRWLLLQAIKTVEAGEDPPAVETSYYALRAIEPIVPDDVPWRDTMLAQMYPAAEPARELVGVSWGSQARIPLRVLSNPPSTGRTVGAVQPIL